MNFSTYTVDDMVALTRTVARFQKKAGYRIGDALPVITFEFVDYGAFDNARMDLMRLQHEIQVKFGPTFRHGPDEDRTLPEGMIEFSFMGVIVRLVCLKKIMTPNGPYAAQEIKIQRPKGTGFTGL